MLLVLQIQAVFAAAWGGDWLLHVPGRDLKYGAEACLGQLVIGGEKLLLPSPLAPQQPGISLFPGTCSAAVVHSRFVHLRLCRSEHGAGGWQMWP